MPFILFHLTVQGTTSLKGDISESESACYSDGAELLDDDARLLRERFDLLLDLPSAQEPRLTLQEGSPQTKAFLDNRLQAFVSSESTQLLRNIFSELGQGHSRVITDRLSDDAVARTSEDIEAFAQLCEAIVAYVDFGEKPTIFES
jgi:hypothetical protein